MKGVDNIIFITGDCHGEFSRFNTRRFPAQKDMTKDDFVIVCGDFGLWHDTPDERYWLDWLNDKPFITLFVDGNHENFDRLYKMPEESWSGGLIHKIRDSVLHLQRGQVFLLDGCKIFTFGGAASHDIQGGILDRKDKNFKRKRKKLDTERACYRIDHESWWKEEIPSDVEMDEGLINLLDHGYSVNYIISHECASNTKLLLSQGFYKPDKLSDYLQKIKENTQFDKWYFGHYHEDRAINDKEILMYEKITQIW